MEAVQAFWHCGVEMTLLDHFLKERSARLKAQAYTSAGAPFTLISDGRNFRVDGWMDARYSNYREVRVETA